MPYRVLPGGASSSRVYLVDGGGNGDQRTIQAALNAAHAQAPTATMRWLVLVGPGVYSESLVLYDHVDLSGLAPGPAAIITAPTGYSAVGTVASCWLTNLKLSGASNPILNLNTAGAELVLDTVTIAEDDPQVAGIKVNTGTLILRNCDIAAGGMALQVGGGTVKATNTRLCHTHANASAPTESAVQIEGGTVLLEKCVLENLSPAGVALHITTNPTSAKTLHSTLRKASGSYAVTADVACANALVVECALNAAIDSDIGVASGNTVDSGV